MSLPFVMARGHRGGLFAAAPAAPAESSTVTNQDDLVGWWKFDGDGTDEIGSADLTLYNDAGFNASTKKFGTHALELDGTSDYASTGNGDITALASAYTFSVWFRLTDTGGLLPGVVGFHVSTTPTNGTAVEILQHGGNVRFYHAATSDQNLTSGGTVSADKWYFVAQTWDGSTISYYYADADTPDAATTLKGTDSADNVQAGVDTLIVGRSQWAYSKLGQYDDLRLYNVALSKSKIDEIYNGGDGDF